jgi:hypothetical protein
VVPASIPDQNPALAGSVVSPSPQGDTSGKAVTFQLWKTLESKKNELSQ